MEKGLFEKTGRPLNDWIAIVKKENLKKHSEMINFLKKSHGFTHGFANFVALKARNADAASQNPEDLLQLQYSGKEHLKPIYEELVTIASGLGPEVEVIPKKSSVSVRAKRQFLLIQPSTKTRIDLGLKFDSMPYGGRLRDSGSFGTMCTHSTSIQNKDDIDEELTGWIKEAYQQSK